MSGAARGVTYSPRETLRLLDMLSEWCEEVAGREVLIVTGGVDVGHCTSIYCQMLDEGDDNRDEVEAALEQTEAAEAAARASQEEVERLKKIVDAHAEAKQQADAAQEQARKEEEEKKASSKGLLGSAKVPGLSGFGLKSMGGMFGQQQAARKASVGHGGRMGGMAPCRLCTAPAA